jgi:hypothetical protein
VQNFVHIVETFGICGEAFAQGNVLSIGMMGFQSLPCV